MENYDNFKKFVDNHYNIEHLKNNNYLKYVKVVRQKIVLSGVYEYDQYIDKINNIFELMNEHYLFYKLNFRKYLFNIKKIFSLLKKRDNSLSKELDRFKKLYDLFDDKNIKFKILKTINSCNKKIILFNKNKRELLYYIDKFNNLEFKYGIDQKLINIVNHERSLIGKKSEYNVNKLIRSYINESDKNSEMKYIYVENVDIYKLFNIKINNNKCKGEIDGLILSKNGNDYVIENLIEIKSSLKATFEDIYKIIGLKNFFLTYKFESDKYISKDIKLNKNSLKKIINYPVHKWLIYICYDDKRKIDKSHLYFSYVLKIIDFDFIQDYYINNKENIIKIKHKSIIENYNYIDNLFNLWKIHVNLNENGSCLFIYK
tara:strand:+ start:2400 stop:3518 length:1119 start_codon:yes stop_codon:yes gene_type:complete